MRTPRDKRKEKLRASARARELVVFSLLGALMLCSKLVMEALPNIHLLGMLTVAYTSVFRCRALIPIYVYVMLNGLLSGFSMWWIPYLYIWAILWALTMLVPRRAPTSLKCVLYPLLCGLHGFAFGTLYAPAQALMFGLSFEQMLAWVIAGLPFDLVHGMGNLAAGLLILPMSELLGRLAKRQGLV